MRGRRLSELDLLRFVAAAAVVLYHYTYRFQAQGGFSPVQYPAAIGAVTRYGFLGVQLFFLISGAVIVRSATGRTAGEFVVARVARLYPAYWAMVTITFVVMHRWGFGPVAPLGWKTYVGNLTMLQGFYGGDLVDGVYWTLACELVFYALVWATLVIGRARHLPAALAVWLTVSVLIEATNPSGEARTWLASDQAPYFIVGAGCALWVGAVDRRSRLVAASLTGAAFPASLWLLGGREVRRLDGTFGAGSFTPLVLQAVFALSAALIFAIVIGRLRWLGRPWMVTAGALTYPVYLVHQNVGAVLFTNLGSWNRWVLLLFVSGFVTLVSWLVHAYVERPVAPVIHRWGGRILASLVRSGRAIAGGGPPNQPTVVRPRSHASDAAFGQPSGRAVRAAASS